jgi:hypothetical protein
MLLILASSQASPGKGARMSATTLNPPRFEFAVESGYLFVFDPPRDYQIATEFVTGRGAGA